MTPSLLLELNAVLFEIEVVEAANNTSYGLGCNVFSENISRALRVAHQLEAGSAWVCLLYRNA